MAGYRVTVENMVTGEQRIKECEGYLLCTFYDAVELEDGKSVYARADIGASNISQVDVMALMIKEENPLQCAWDCMLKMWLKPWKMRRFRKIFKGECLE